MAPGPQGEAKCPLCPRPFVHVPVTPVQPVDRSHSPHPPLAIPPPPTRLSSPLRRRRRLSRPASPSATAARAMAQRADSSSSSASRATRRQGRGVSSVCEQHPVGKETGLPLIVCPDCDLARVIEVRVVKPESQNKGRIFFKCPRNGVSCEFFSIFNQT